MALLTRFSRLLSADMHALLDRLEEPEECIAQALRDMEEAHQRLVLEQRRLTRHLADLDHREERLSSLLDDANDQLQVCLDNDADDLARGAIRRQLELKAQLADTCDQQKATRADLATATRHLESQTTELEALRSQAATIDRAQRPAPQTNQAANHKATTDDEIEVALLSAKAQRRAAS